MMSGYAGKILRVDLSSGAISSIETAQYDDWVGGHGMGSAIFFDLCKDKTVSGFDPANVVTIMTSPLTGTLTPGAAGRTEIQGIGVQSSPMGWFTRSNLGGRFGAMLKMAGWDGLVIVGASDEPVWLDIRDGKISIRSAKDLWGKDAWLTQQMIWSEVMGGSAPGWWTVGESERDPRTTQRPAVLAIGPAGENLSRLGALIHDAGNAAGQGGFGGVFGSKKLKAISAVGTGHVKVHDPHALLEARTWAREYMHDPDDAARLTGGRSMTGDIKMRNLGTFGSPPVPVVFWKRRKQSRAQACVGCPAGCRARNDNALGNESSCAETFIYTLADAMANSSKLVKAGARVAAAVGGDPLAMIVTMMYGEQSDAGYQATDLCQRMGINAFEFMFGIPYLRDLYKMGALPRDGLDFNKFGEFEFARQLFEGVAFRRGLGDDIAEGFYRASQRWGRLEQDLGSGLLQMPHWGLPVHYDPRFQTEWGYGTILGDRDINEHCFNVMFFTATMPLVMRKQPLVTAYEAAKIYSDRMAPFAGQIEMLDYSDEGTYSDGMVKLVAWHRGYTRFWKQSALFCDFLFPDFLNPARDDRRGMVGLGEPKFLRAVTGRDISFEEGIDLGRKIFTLDNAVWTLQGRTREMVQYADYIYEKPWAGPAYMPGLVKGEWEWVSAKGRKIDRARFEDFKTRFYKMEGWDPDTGWALKKTMTERGLTAAAAELSRAGKLPDKP